MTKRKIKQPTQEEVLAATADEVVSVVLRFSAKLFAELKREKLISGAAIEADFKEWQVVFEEVLNKKGTIRDVFERLPNNTWGNIMKAVREAMPSWKSPRPTAAGKQRFAERVAGRIMKKREL